MAISASSAVASGVYTPTTTTVARTSNPTLAARAANLSATASVVATLGTSSSSQVYSAAGMLNSFARAGTSAASSTAPTPGNDAASLANSSNWASILKANPSAAAYVVGASYTSGIINTLA